MDKEKEPEEINPLDIEEIAVKIVDEKKQLGIRIPKKLVDVLQIDPDKDAFVFTLNKKDLHLIGELVDKKDYEKELKNEEV